MADEKKKSSVVESMKFKNEAPADWKAPERPQDSACGCGAMIAPQYVDPIWIGDRAINGTGVWEFASGACAACQKKADDKARAASHIEETRRNMTSAGFFPKHLKMELANYKVSPGTKRAWDACREFAGGAPMNLLLIGDRGAGKTHMAVGAQKERIRRGARGVFKNVPLMMLENRQRMFNGQADEMDMVRELVETDTLVLDEIGVDKASDWVLRTLYVLTEYWDAHEKTGLILTSNLTLDEIRLRVDDRVASRLSGMCRIIEVKQKDFRASRSV